MLRGHVAEHVQLEHLAQSEQDGLASSCPALTDGCTVCFGPPLLPLVENRHFPCATPIQRHGDRCVRKAGSDDLTPYGAAARHMFGCGRTQPCALLQYLCASCGCPAPRRQASCGTEQCHHAGVRRGAMPHLLHWADAPPTPDIVTRWGGDGTAGVGAGAGIGSVAADGP